MRTLQTLVIASVLGLSAGIAGAQAGAGKGPGGGAGPVGTQPGASVPAMGAGQGAGRGAAQWGADFTSGWALMSQSERNDQRDRMRSMKTYEECHAYQNQHHEQMTARAKERGDALPSQPRRDACAGLPK
jgi:hypothetical protein